MLLWLLPLSDAPLWQAPPSPHVSTWQPPCCHRWIHGGWFSIRRGAEGEKTHCTLPVRPLLLSPMGSWLNCLLSCLCLWARWPSVTGATHVNGPDAQCEISPSVKPWHIDGAALHSDCCCIPFRFGCYSLTSTRALEIDPTWNKKALLCYLSSFLSFILH